MSSDVDYSVVIPVYNGSNSVEKLLHRISSTFGNIGKSWEVIFVDDNSMDNSWEVLKGLKKYFSATTKVTFFSSLKIL